MDFIKSIISLIYNFLWGDLITIPLPGGSSLGLSLLVIILIPSGIYFTFKTKFVLFRYFPEMIRISTEKKNSSDKNSLSGLQALIVSTATRVGMGNLVGVVAAISAGGAGAVFWMWVTAILNSSTAFIEATLAQIYKEKDPLYGGFRGGPAYYINALFTKNKRKKRSVIAILFAISGLICWGGISQVIGNSVSSAFESAFDIPPLYTTVVACLFGDNWTPQTVYKIFALAMLFIGGLASYTFVWDLGDIGIGLMTIFNMIALFPLSKQALHALKDYKK